MEQKKGGKKMKKAKKITVTLRLYPEEALDLLTYSHNKKFITAKQYMKKTDKAMANLALFQED